MTVFISSLIRVNVRAESGSWSNGYTVHVEDAEGADITPLVKIHGMFKQLFGEYAHWIEIELDREGFDGRFCIPSPIN